MLKTERLQVFRQPTNQPTNAQKTLTLTSMEKMKTSNIKMSKEYNHEVSGLLRMEFKHHSRITTI